MTWEFPLMPVLGARRARSGPDGTAPRAKSPTATRLVATEESQGLQVQKKGRGVGKAESGLDSKLLGSHAAATADEDGDAARIDRALQVDLGIADEPDVG